MSIEPGSRHDGQPNYDPVEQGLADDLREVPYTTKERQARQRRYSSRQHARQRDRFEELTPEQLRELLACEQREGSELAAPSNLAVIYLRVSTEEQAKVGGTAEGYSIPYQRTWCRKKAAELGLTVVGEYVDAGHSAKSTRRPELQRMLRELPTLGASFVIIHKIDRLARNTRDDHKINDQIAAAGARLISVVDLIDDSPQGRFNYTIQAGLAQLYSDNLAQEVIKGLSEKAKSGGTPYRAPVGYLNKRRFEGVADIRWVEVDPVRGPLVSWAFKEYAGGEWSVIRLLEALGAKGMTNSNGRPLSNNGLYTILTNPYYTGIVPFQGAYYEGTHEPLTDLQTWLRVQDVLKAHNFAGEKSTVHAHYLKGSIYCSDCGSRLLFSRNRGRGGTYDYFMCLGRHRKRNDCKRKAVPVSAVEEGVEDVYLRFQLKAEQTEWIRTGVSAEFARLQAVADTEKRRARRRIQEAETQRQKLLTALYNDAIPEDLLKQEMQRLTVELGNAEAQLKENETSLEELDEQLDRALYVASHSTKLYAAAKPAVRRQLNQGFFEKLYVNERGAIVRAEVTEPFASLRVLSLAISLDKPKMITSTTADPLNDDQDGGETVFLSAGVPGRSDAPEDDQTPGRMVSTGGLNVAPMAVAVGFEPTDGD
ncbi:recombinase family protein [Amycolatopsis sp. NPDC051128]|uniref:recombinase family protein n=1 Tax=Amycolatopsis sp. NPDC051128 TaxID=3155412 RepID=UPI0034300B06